MSYIPQQQYPQQQFQQMPGTSMPVQQQVGGVMPTQQYQQQGLIPNQYQQQRLIPNQYHNIQQSNVPIQQKYPQKTQVNRVNNQNPHYKQPQHKHNPKRYAGMIAGTAAGTAIANTIPMPGHGFSRTAGRLAAGLVGGHYVAKGVNKHVH